MNIEYILLIIAGVLLVALLTDDIILRVRRRKLLQSFLQITVENMTIKDQLANLPLLPSETEGFIKFLSESREWAFTYIEDVQKAITDLSVAMENDDKDKISKAYEEVVSFLPKNEVND